MNESNEYEKHPITMKYKDDKLEQEFHKQHQINTVIFGKIIVLEILLVNVIDIMFETYEYFYENDHSRLL